MTPARVLRIVAGMLLIVQLPFTLSFAQADDSPGLGGLAMLASVAGLVLVVGAFRRGGVGRLNGPPGQS